MPTRRQNVVPGAILVVMNNGITADTDAFHLNPHRLLYQNASPVQLQHGDILHVLAAPRKIDGINLVRVRRAVGHLVDMEGEVYYIDIIRRCSTQEDLMHPPKVPRKKALSNPATVEPKTTSPSRHTAWDRIMEND